MSEPKMAGKTPVVTVLKEGSYYWCACGLSAGQPFCDGSHKGTDITPMEFSIDESKQVALCNCKRTTNAPYCDGTHKNL